MRYGIKFENVALEIYSKRFNVTILECGNIINYHNKWFCVSPDGIIIKQGKFITVLEIKFPISCQNKPIFDLIKNILNIPYVNYENNGLLKPLNRLLTVC